MSALIHFTESQINDIVSSYASGSSLSQIGERYNVSRPTIQRVVRGNYPAYTGKKRASIVTENQTKICSKCGRELLLEYFNKGNCSYGRRSFCRECEKEIQNTPERRARRRELELLRIQDPEHIKHRNEMDKKARLKNPKHWLWVSAKFRAKKKNLEFTITEDDFDLPDICPLLEIPMHKNPERACGASYSLDRIDSSKGYIPGNVWVISKRANAIKSDATLEELELLVKNLRKRYAEDNVYNN